jgi:sporulation protein YlmC with PRC-barrel domain
VSLVGKMASMNRSEASVAILPSERTEYDDWEHHMFNRIRSKPRFSRRVSVVMNNRLVGTTSLLGDDVYDAAGKFVGEIEEIILDTRTGGVRCAVLALGGFLGIGRKRFAVPWNALTPDADYQLCVVDLAPTQFRAVPVPNDDPWLQQTDPTWDRENAYMLRPRALLGVTLPRNHFLRL